MNKPTKEEVEQQIGLLRSIRNLIQPFSLFGNDNKAALDAVVEVLVDGLDEESVYANWPEEYDESESQNSYIRDSALEACRWLNGDEAAMTPYENFKGLVIKPAKG